MGFDMTNEAMWGPSKAFLEWLDELPPTKKVMERRAVELKDDRHERAAARGAAIIARREGIIAARAARKANTDPLKKRGRKAKVQETYPNSRVHLMEDNDDEDEDDGQREPATKDQHAPLE